jgi:surfactin synthase thioesterase subunit
MSPYARAIGRSVSVIFPSMHRLNLIFFPFAGGNRYSYLQLQKLLDPAINVVNVELPGRGDRVHQSLLTSVEDMTADAFGKLLPILHEPFALYGHSMGGIIAYLFARQSIANNFFPKQLFISGKSGPTEYDDDKSYLLPSDSFRQKLRELGGMPDEILDNELLMEFFEPIIKADFKAIKTYQHRKDEPVNIPITLMLGEADSISIPSAMLWQDETRKQIAIHQFSGGHFFLYQHLQSIADLLSYTLISRS